MRFLTVKDLSTMLQVSESLIYELVDAGEIISTKIRGCIRFAQEDVDTFLSENRVQKNGKKTKKLSRPNLKHIKLS